MDRWTDQEPCVTSRISWWCTTSCSPCAPLPVEETLSRGPERTPLSMAVQNYRHSNNQPSTIPTRYNSCNRYVGCTIPPSLLLSRHHMDQTTPGPLFDPSHPDHSAPLSGLAAKSRTSHLSVNEAPFMVHRHLLPSYRPNK
jgi:hypothetical protein